jgi:hypothetical protein
MTIETLSIDLGKTTCSIVGLAGTGTVVFRQGVNGRQEDYPLIRWGILTVGVMLTRDGRCSHAAVVCAHRLISLKSAA